MKVHIFHIVQEGLTNAIKHAKASSVRAVVRAGSVDGAAQTANGAVEVSIEDDGVGLTREMKAETGLGLGLIGIRERALALGGQMTVGSGPDKVRRERRHSKHSGVSKMRPQSIRVLLVDDHAIVREGFRRLLEKQEGIAIVGEADNAASAYQVYKDKSPTS